MIRQLMRLLRRSDKPGVLGIEIGPYGLALAWVNEGEDDAKALGQCLCHYIEGNDLAENGEKLKQYLDDLGLFGTSAHVVLHPDIYKIYFVDRPEVEEAELSEAVRWKIKDLVDSPLDELVIDAFSLPDDAYGGNQKKAYAVTIKRSQMNEIVEMLETNGVSIIDIGISELAVENIVRRFRTDDGGAAILRMRNAGGTINLSDAGYLYLTRSLECGISMIELGEGDLRQDGLDALLLEVQRSLDFYESQLGKGRVRKFLMAPTRVPHTKIDDYLRSNLGVNVQSLDVNDLFDVKEEISEEMQAYCFAAIGAACSESP